MSTSETTLAHSQTAKAAHKLPHSLFDDANRTYAFPPNRETLGGTAYLIPHHHLSNSASESKNILVDCPAWTEANLDFIAHQGGIKWLVITHRGGSSRVKNWQSRFNCDVILQEQEAYLLPQVNTHTFHRSLDITSAHRLIWTPGHSPGSLCLYSSEQGGILFTGRHLLPTRQGGPAPLRVSKTFHWPRQLRSSKRLLEDFNPETLHYLCPGANVGFLRGKRVIGNAYGQLASLDFQTLAQAEALL